MAVEDRIKRIRNLRGLTQKGLGLAIGYDDNTADVRVAQYESGTRTPKDDTLRKIAEVLNVNYRAIYEPTLYAVEDVMYTLFELDEHYKGMQIYDVTDNSDPTLSEEHKAVSFNTHLLDAFLAECQQRKKPCRWNHQQGRVYGVEIELAADGREQPLKTVAQAVSHYSKIHTSQKSCYQIAITGKKESP